MKTNREGVVRDTLAYWKSGLTFCTLSHIVLHLAFDAFACAQILIKAREKGHIYEDLLKKHALKPAEK